MLLRCTLALVVAGSVATSAQAAYVLRQVSTVAASVPDRLAILAPPVMAGHAGSPVAVPLAALSASGPVRWAARGLPEGVGVDDGAILGASDDVGPFLVDVEARDSGGAVARAELQFVMLPPMSVAVSESRFAVGVESRGPSASVTGSPVAPVRFALAGGALPAGLRLDWRTGAVVGKTDAPGLYTVVVAATDATGARVTSDAVRIAVGPAGRGVVEGDGGAGFVVSLPSRFTSRVGASVRGVLPVVTGGPVAPVTWSLVDPVPGIEVDAEGRLVGSPTGVGRTMTEIKGVDAAGSTAYSSTFSVDVRPALTLAPMPTAILVAGEAVRIAAPGVANAPRGGVVWSAGGLPDGLEIDRGSGVVRGRPSVAGTFVATLIATDQDGDEASGEATLVVRERRQAIVLRPLAPAFHLGSTRVPTVEALGGSGRFRFTLRRGALPAGASFDAATGDIVAPGGFEGPVGSLDLEVEVVDDEGRSAASGPFKAVVLPRYPLLGDRVFGHGVVDREMVVRLPDLPSGAALPVRWEVSSSLRSAGFLVDATSGVLHGTPSEPGVLWGVVRGVDRFGAPLLLGSASSAVSVVVAPSVEARTVEVVVHADYVRIAAPEGEGDRRQSVWQLIGELPRGLTFHDGLIEGSLPWTNSRFSVGLLSRSSKATTVWSFDVEVLPPLTLDRLPDTAVAPSEAFELRPPRVENDFGILSWRLEADRGVPEGIAVDSATGCVTGVVARPGRYRLALVVSDQASGEGRSQSFVIDVGDKDRVRSPSVSLEGMRSSLSPFLGR